MPPRRYPCTKAALVAAVTNNRGEFTGVHQTYLDPKRKDKAQISSPRRSLGAILGNGVRFGRIDDVVLVGEGIETMLSIKSVLPRIPTVEALSASHLAAWEFPAGPRRLIIACDNDEAGRQAARRLKERARRIAIDMLTITSLRSDFNSDRRAMPTENFRQRLKALISWVKEVLELNEGARIEKPNLNRSRCQIQGR